MMTLTSSSFGPSAEMPQPHGKQVANLSPALSWTDPPRGTRSFALAMVDKDPIARDFVHWLVVDVGPDTSTLQEGASEGAMPSGSRQAMPYSGPFPPSGTHNYEFTLYALDTPKVDLPKKLTLQQFSDMVSPHALATATLMGKFTRME